MGMSDRTPEQQAALDNFVNLTEIMSKRQQQVEELGRLRREAAIVLKESGVTVADMAKAAGIGPQAVYKLMTPSPASKSE